MKVPRWTSLFIQGHAIITDIRYSGITTPVVYTPRGRTFTGIQSSPTRAFAGYPAGCCCSERFNVFTPPMRRRIGLGMLIAHGTIVGFFDGHAIPRPGCIVHREEFCFISTHVYARNMSGAFTSRFVPICSIQPWRSNVNVRANLKITCSVKLLF